ncbi:MAG: type IA DNA topoisomerase [Lachnospiraceae bacterium]|nr:type IA DNA topoisomerase [Lachnospiraceae bacterium]
MGKNLYIAEKPSVAQEFARVLSIRAERKDGYLESDTDIVTWCVGHLVTMSYPDAYDPALKKWSMNTLPFIPDTWKYEVIESVKKQFGIVSKLLTRKDVETIYVCTDSGREGEYIYRLVAQEAHVTGKTEKRVWIDSQTEEEIRRGIREAKDLSAYDNLADSAYLRAKEDYLMGINFSRALTLKFGNVVAGTLREQRAVLSVGRVMTCVLGMVVRREREIRSFVPQKFYRVLAGMELSGERIEGEWRAVKGSRYENHPALYKENGFKKREDAEELVRFLSDDPPLQVEVLSCERKTESKKAPLLFNLAELQNECSRRFKISPDQTLSVVQELYEKKLVTYPRTDARVLSSAVAKEIAKNIGGLKNVPELSGFAAEILEKKSYAGIGRSMYTDDKKITDHYAIIPTGQGISALNSLKTLQKQVYDLICRRFLCIFYPPAKYTKVALMTGRKGESFFSNFRMLAEPGYLTVLGTKEASDAKDEKEGEKALNAKLLESLQNLKKGTMLPVSEFSIREGETTPPKRYSSGSLILTMENAGQFIEDEELRAQIKGSGIGTSATRAEIIKKLVTIKYLKINGKTQIVTPTLQGELVYDVVEASMPQLLNPDLTASWEKGLSYVAEGTITTDEYMEKMTGFVRRRTDFVKNIGNPEGIRRNFDLVLPYYAAAKRR